jgi:hypothetical protein
LRQDEFCRNHGLALSTLRRQRKRRRLDKREAKKGGQTIEVRLGTSANKLIFAIYKEDQFPNFDNASWASASPASAAFLNHSRAFS